MTKRFEAVGSKGLEAFTERVRERIASGQLTGGSAIDLRSFKLLPGSQRRSLIRRVVDQHYIGAAIHSVGVYLPYGFTRGESRGLRLVYPAWVGDRPSTIQDEASMVLANAHAGCVPSNKRPLGIGVKIGTDGINRMTKAERLIVAELLHNTKVVGTDYKLVWEKSSNCAIVVPA